MNSIFPFEQLNEYEEDLQTICNIYRMYLEKKLPRLFNGWFVMKNYEDEHCSYNHIVDRPGRTFSDTMLNLRNNNNIVINLLDIEVTHVPIPNKNFDRSDYNGKHKPTTHTYDELYSRFPYMFCQDKETIKFSIDASYAIYICTHEWFHTMTYVDWESPCCNSDYLWYMELQTDVKAIQFLRANANEITNIFADMYTSDGKPFVFELEYIEEISRACNEYIRSRIPKCIFE